MRIGLIVEGRAEYSSLPHLRLRLTAETSATLIGPLVAVVNPTATPPVVAKGCRAPLLVLRAKRADQAVVLLDREDIDDCPGDRATELADELNRPGIIPVVVVLKDRMFENWLVADTRAFRRQPARFKVTTGLKRRVEPNKADQVDAIAWLQQATAGRYEKVADAERILKLAEPRAIAANSRSFRRLLRVLGHPDYGMQSKNPA
jgi:hypothetical protein